MEGQDVFAQEEIAEDHDPFADSDFGDFDTTEAAAPVEDAVLPIVDREGNVQASESPATEEGAPATVETRAVPETHMVAGAHVGPRADSAPPPAASPAPEAASAAPAPSESPQEAQAPPAAPQGAPESAPDASAAAVDPTPPSSPEQPAEAVAEAVPEPEPAPEPSPAPQAEQTGDGDVQDAPPPKPKSKAHRRYVILRIDDQDQYSRVQWYEDNKGRLTSRGSGAKRQNSYVGKTTEEALKFGYAAIGAPPEGAVLVAIAEHNFQPRKLKPLPPEPMRQRLQIT